MSLSNPSGSGASVHNFCRQARELIFCKIHVTNLFANSDADTSSRSASFLDCIADEANVFGFASDFNSGTIVITAVFDNVVFDHVAIRPEVESSIFVAKQDSELAAVANLVIPHHVVGVVVPDGDAVQSVAIDDVIFCQSVFDAPAPEDALTVAFQLIAANNRSLRTRAWVNSEIRVVVAVAIFHDDIVADLETDPVAVVITSSHSAERVTIAILQKDTAAIVAVKVFTVLAIAIERDVFNDHISRVLAGQ